MENGVENDQDARTYEEQLHHLFFCIKDALLKAINEELLADPEDKQLWNEVGFDAVIEERFAELLKELNMEESLSALHLLGANNLHEDPAKATLSLSKDIVAHAALPQIHAIHTQVEETYKQLLKIYKDTQHELIDTEQELSEVLAQIKLSIAK